jgi:hypothetical protein
MHALCLLAAMAQTITIAPRIEIFTTLACMVHKPEYTSVDAVNPFWASLVPDTQNSSTNNSSLYLVFFKDASDSTGSKLNRCASDPVVQAAVATLTLGKYYRLPRGH